MAVLTHVLETLSDSELELVAYDRSGKTAGKVDATQFIRAIQSFRSAFQGWDVDGRKVIGLLFKPEETVEFLIATLAAISERWTVVPLYPNWSEATQKMYMEAYRIRAVVAGDGFRSRVESWQLAAVPAGDGPASDREVAPLVDRVLHVALDELVHGEASEPADAKGALLENVPPGHPCAWIFTSGTSGNLAKLTEITLENIDAAVENIRDIDFLYRGMTLHSPLSASHVFAFVVILGLLAVKPRRLIFSDVQYLPRLPQARLGKVNGVILVPIVVNRMRSGFYEKLVSSLDPKTAPPALRRLARVPLPLRKQLKRILQNAEEAMMQRENGEHIGLRRRGAILMARRLFGRVLRERLGSPEFVVIGGAKPNLHAMAFLEVMGIRCLQGWGMTETTGPLAVSTLRDRGAFGTCGQLFSDSKAFIEDGELIVEGPQIARGYHQPDGEFVPFNGRKSTGDYAEFDPSGRLMVLGKASDRITTENGLNYNPLPLEEALQDCDLEKRNLFEEIVVIGDGQPRLGAVFFRRDGVEDEASTRAYVRDLLKTFNTSLPVDERLEAWSISPISFKESGYLGPSGKLIRRLVEKEHSKIFHRDAVGAT